MAAEADRSLRVAVAWQGHRERYHRQRTSPLGWLSQIVLEAKCYEMLRCRREDHQPALTEE